MRTDNVIAPLSHLEAYALSKLSLVAAKAAAQHGEPEIEFDFCRMAHKLVEAISHGPLPKTAEGMLAYERIVLDYMATLPEEQRALADHLHQAGVRLHDIKDEISTWKIVRL